MGGAEAIADPFATRTITIPACPGAGVDWEQEGGSHTLSPGVHCGEYQLHGNATLTLLPGEHYFRSGYFMVHGTARLVGDGVTVFFDSSSTLQVKESPRIDLKGSKSGAWAGVVLVSARDNTNDLLLSSDNVDRLEGVIYLPAAKLVVSGGAGTLAQQSNWTVTVTKALVVTGSPTLVINADYGKSDVPVPAGVGPPTGGTRLLN